jgi:hypothetical protein
MSGFHNYDRRQKTLLTKKVLTAFLIICVIEGLATIILASWLSSQQIKCSHTQVYYAGSYIGLLDGVILVLAGAFGLNRIHKSQTCELLSLFTMATFAIVVAHLTITIFCHIYRNKVMDQQLFRDLYGYLLAYSDNDRSKTCWNSLQDEFSCCGLQHFTDWHNITLDNSSSIIVDYTSRGILNSRHMRATVRVPDSCGCDDVPQYHRFSPCQTTNNYTDMYFQVNPCYAPYEDLILNNLNILRIYFPVLLVFQVVQCIVVFSLVVKVNNTRAVEQIYSIS